MAGSYPELLAIAENAMKTWAARERLRARVAYITNTSDKTTGALQDDTGIKNIGAEVLECGPLRRLLRLLAEAGESPAKNSRAGATLGRSLSFPCAGARAGRLPPRVGPWGLFAGQTPGGGRQAAVQRGRTPYLSLTGENKLMNMFRRYCGTDHPAPAPGEELADLFFPGCTLLTYPPA